VPLRGYRRFSGHTVMLRSSPTVFADTSMSGSTSTRTQRQLKRSNGLGLVEALSLSGTYLFRGVSQRPWIANAQVSGLLSPTAGAASLLSE
jgi:hypothetical protein